jgi:hypothetical protein
MAAAIGLVILLVNLGPCSVGWKFVTHAEASQIEQRVTRVEQDLAEHKAQSADVYQWTKDIHDWVRNQQPLRKKGLQ